MKWESNARLHGNGVELQMSAIADWREPDSAKCDRQPNVTGKCIERSLRRLPDKSLDTASIRAQPANYAQNYSSQY
jgi:hypothetical protein